MQIRDEQLEVFQPQAEAAFEARVVEHLREEHGDEIVYLPGGEFTVGELPHEVLLEMVRTGIERARGYGITWETTLIDFVVIMFGVAPNFDEHPLIRRILMGEAVKPNLSIDELWLRTTDENWAAARKTYNPDAWNIAPADDSELISRIVAHLQEHYAADLVMLPKDSPSIKEIPEETLRLMVRAGLNRARGYGLASEEALASFVVLMVVVAPNFDTQTVINKILRDASRPPDERIQALWELTTEEDWQAAQRDYQAGAWGLGLQEA